MLEPICLVHYHEIGLKGKNRAHFEQVLKNNLKAKLAPYELKQIERISGHLLVSLKDIQDADKLMDLILKTPGVARCSMGYRTDREMEHIFEAAKRCMDEAGDFFSFKVECRRSNTDFPIDSMQLNQLLGAYLCEQFPSKKVLMHDPDLICHLRIVQGSAYLYARTQEGVGGLPVGTAGKVVCLLSSGIDSPVSCWRMMKRGAQIVPLHFSGRPQSSDESEYLVKDILDCLRKRADIPYYYTLPFGDIQKEISLQVPDSIRIIMYRRFMYAIASRLAKIEGAKALVTGESLGQVASQTLENLMAVDEMADLPVFRPLIGSDKREIIAEAQSLGTYEISTETAPDCCTLFMPRKPETHAKLTKVHEAWDLLAFDELMEQALSSLEKHKLEV